MDRGTNALDVLEGRSYRLQHPWVGPVNCSQADINRNVDVNAARRSERGFFATSPEYRHIQSRLGSEYLAKLLSKQLEAIIKARIPGVMSLINKRIDDLEEELNHLGGKACKHFLNSRRITMYCGNGEGTKGFTRSYQNFRFYWIDQAGHFVPVDQPCVSLDMIGNITQSPVLCVLGPILKRRTAKSLSRSNTRGCSQAGINDVGMVAWCMEMSTPRVPIWKEKL